MLKPTPRREQERQQHIKHILDVAESIFAEQGFFRATRQSLLLERFIHISAARGSSMKRLLRQKWKNWSILSPRKR
jgi:hypothetical protein